MKLFKANKGIKVPGHKKDTYLSQTEEFLKPEYVYIPLSLRGSDFEVYVKAGDQVKLGQPIARRDEKKGLPIVKHATVSGEVVGMERKTHRTGMPFQSIVIKNDFQDTPYEDFKGVANIDSLDHESLVNLLAENGVVGLGGSGYPTFLKYRDAKNIDTVILNGAECEPYVTADYRVMIEETAKVFDGLTIMMKAAKASKGIIAIKKNYHVVYKALAQEAKKYPNISIVLLPSIYPAGWERTVVYRSLKRTYDKYPFECGVIVNNVSTAAAVSQVVREGKPLMERIITVAGEGVVSPKNVRIRVGTLASDVIEFSRGLATDMGDLRIIAGGPMTGTAQKNTDFVATRALNGITVLPGFHEYHVPHNQPIGDVLMNVLHFVEHDPNHFERDEQPCVRCMSCVKACPAGLQPTLLRTAALNKDEKLLAKLDVEACISCGSCTYSCPSHISLSETITKGKTFYASKQRLKNK
jgi:Na+-translocating ferredoxin:NAD+ oxidoreductase subunit C